MEWNRSAKRRCIISSPKLGPLPSLQLVSVVHLGSGNLDIGWGCVESLIAPDFRRLGMRLVNLRVLHHAGFVVARRRPCACLSSAEQEPSAE